MEEAFAAGSPPVGLGATAHAAALAWTLPGFAAFDAGGTHDEQSGAEPPAGDARANTTDAGSGHLGHEAMRNSTVEQAHVASRHATP